MKSKKITFSRMQRDIACLLEEAGEENLACMLNTLKCDHATESQANLLMEMSIALRGLIRIGYVTASGNVESLSDHHFGPTGVEIAITLTERGRRLLTE